MVGTRDNLEEVKKNKGYLGKKKLTCNGYFGTGKRCKNWVIVRARDILEQVKMILEQVKIYFPSTTHTLVLRDIYR